MLASYFLIFEQKTAYEMRISDGSSDVCSSDLRRAEVANRYTADRRAFPAQHLAAVWVDEFLAEADHVPALRASFRHFLQIDEAAGALDDVRIDEAQHIRCVAQFVGVDQPRRGEEVANAFERNRRDRLLVRQLAHARRKMRSEKRR